MRLRSVAAAIVASCLAGSLNPVQAQSGPINAGLYRVVDPGSTSEKFQWNLWGAPEVDVAEYRLTGSALEEALRTGSLELDPALLTPRRTWHVTGDRGEVPVSPYSGVYVFVARGRTAWSPDAVHAEAVIVSNLRLAAKRDDTSSLVVVHRRGQPAGWVDLNVYQAAEGATRPTLLRSLDTNPWGLLAFATPRQGSLIYVARDGANVAIQTTWDRSWSAPQAFLGHVQTDRPLYRPGQVVHWKAVVRETVVQSNSYRTPVNEEVRAFLRGPDGNRTPLGTFRTSSFGTVHGSYQLSDAARHGEYQVEVDAGRPDASAGERSVGAIGFGVEAYRKPEFKLTVTPALATYVQGQTVEATLAGDYFFGAPVSGARVQYTVKKQPRWRWWNPWIRPMIADFCFPRPWVQATVVATGEVTLGQDGRGRVSFASAADGVDADYTIEARASDASEREVVGSAQVAVTRAAFDLVLVSDRYVYQPGDTIQLQAQAQNAAGAPARGARVTFKGEAVDPQGTRTLRFTQTLVTGADGSALLRVRAQNLGEYVISATATDAAGNVVSSERWLFIHEQRSGTDWSWTDVKLTADREAYEPGQTAKILVRAPIAAGVGVLAVESQNMHRRQAFTIVGGLALVSVPVTAEMSPNAFVSVIVPTRDGFRSAQHELLVPPSDALVEVKITADKDEYRPGETATFRVQTVDGRGNPVAAEVALGVVDEALFALREDATPRLDETFFAKRWDAVSTVGADQTGGWRILGGPEVFMAAPMRNAKSAQGEQGGVREYFPDTLRWIAQVVTDQSGQATITQVMADSLTTWRLTSRAVTADSRFGQSTRTTLVRKDLLVRLIAPRTLVEGDELTLTGIVHNLAKPGTAGADPAQVRVQLAAEGLTVLGAQTSTVSVPRDGQAVVRWSVRVDRAGPARLTASATGSFDQDALRLTLPVAARGVAERQVQAGALLQDGSATHGLAKSPRAIDGGTELRVQIAPSLAGTLLDSLDYLTGYPYGCIEQTMSRFLPDVVVVEVLRTIGREDATLLAELPAMVKAGVERIQGMQNADGGWGWFANNQSHPYVTAYVVGGLAKAAQNRYEVPEPMYGNALAFLEQQVQGGQLDGNGKAYVLHALAEAGRVRRADLVALAGQRATLNAYTQACLALALGSAGETTLARDVVRDLERSARTQAGKTFWQGDTLSYGSWTANLVETTALVARAFLAVDPTNAKVTEAVAWLLERRQDNGQYTTTKDTAQVVLTFAKYVVVTRELDPDLEAVVKVNGAEVARVRFVPADLAAKGRTVKIPGAQLRSGANTVEVSRAGRGALYYSAVLEQHVRMDPIPAEERGISVRREYFKVTRRLDQDGNMVEDLTPLAGEVRVGERLRVKLTLRVSQNAAVEHVNLEDRFPVGFEVADDQDQDLGWWRWWRSAKEVHDDKVVFFATQLALVHPEGGQEYEYTYDLRAEVAGRFLALPTYAEAVYDPATHGRSAADVITVR